MLRSVVCLNYLLALLVLLDGFLKHLQFFKHLALGVETHSMQVDLSVVLLTEVVFIFRVEIRVVNPCYHLGELSVRNRYRPISILDCMFYVSLKSVGVTDVEVGLYYRDLLTFGRDVF